MIEIQPVLLLAGFRKALAAGAAIEIECVKDAAKEGNLWLGEWKIYILAKNGSSFHRIALGVSRTQEPKVFKTVTGLMSFGNDHGVDLISIPTVTGMCAEWKRREGESEAK